MHEISSALLAHLAGLLDTLNESTGVATYLLMIAGLVIGAVGVPVPEEAVFATGGALAGAGRASLPLVYGIGWAAVLILDLALHAAGRALGPRVETSRWGRRIRPERWARARDLMERRGVLVVMAARFVMGARIPVFLLAGASGMPRGRFLLAVGTAGLVSTAVPTSLGYLFGAHLETVVEALAKARWAVLVLVLLVVVVWWRRRRP